MRPRKARRVLLGGIVTALITGSAIGWGIGKAAADPIGPINSDCETGFMGTMWCDGPIKPDGTWTRCFTTAVQWTAPGGSYPGFGYVPQVQRCFPYNPVSPPGLPLGQPAGRIGAGL